MLLLVNIIDLDPLSPLQSNCFWLHMCIEDYNVIHGASLSGVRRGDSARGCLNMALPVCMSGCCSQDSHFIN